MAHGVLVEVVEVQGEVSFAGVTMRANARNFGTGKAYAAACGGTLLVIVERQQNGQWVEGPLPDCGPGAAVIELAAGATTFGDRAFAEIGRYRLSVIVADNVGLNSSSRSRSAPFTID